MILEDFKVGDVLLVTTKMRCGVTVRTAIVRTINYNGLGLVGYAPCKYKDYPDSGQGSIDPAKVGNTPWGIQKVEFVEHRKVHSAMPGRTSYPRPGNTAYDLMC